MRYLLLCVCFVFACTEIEESFKEQEKQRLIEKYISTETKLRTDILSERKLDYLEEYCDNFLFNGKRDALNYRQKYWYLHTIYDGSILIYITPTKYFLDEYSLKFIASQIRCYDESNTVEFKFTDNTTHEIKNEGEFRCEGGAIEIITNYNSKTHKILTSKTIEKIRINGYSKSITFSIPLEKDIQKELGRKTSKENLKTMDMASFELDLLNLSLRGAGMLSAEMIQKTLSCLNKESK